VTAQRPPILVDHGERLMKVHAGPWGVDIWIFSVAAGVNFHLTEEEWPALRDEIEARFRESGVSVPDADPQGATKAAVAAALHRGEPPVLNKSGGSEAFGRAQTDTICGACGAGRGVACAADCPRRSPPTVNKSGGSDVPEK
jgi:hypothetical protein